jgi:SAM-dependent methyltransferase
VVVAKKYDRQYFEHWYRHEGFGSPVHLERKVHYALAATEYLLERPVRSVLDVGCGEAPWRAALRRQRPASRYVGVDPSEYAVERYGAQRGIVLGSLGNLHTLGIDDRFDLVVCSDVIAYVPDAHVRRGLETIAGLLLGLAFVEVFTAADDFEGDLDGYRRRRPSTYERWFAEAGLTHLGPSLLCRIDLAASLPRI